jgi:hypothetical protein
MTWTAETNVMVAHALHRVAWSSEDPRVFPYVETDRRLRRSAGEKPPEPPGDGRATLADALTAEHRVRWDSPWFERRWTSGEDVAMGQAAERVVAEATLIADGGLLPGGWSLVATPVLARCAVACPRVQRVGIGPRCDGILAVLTAVASRLPPDMDPEPLDPEERRLVRLHTAATAILRQVGDDEALRPSIAAAVRALLPRPGERDAYGARVRRIAERGLDQPPGEIERIADGLARGQASRLHRAWRRGFFVPAEFDLDQWLSDSAG